MSTVLVIDASRGIGLEFVRQYREAGRRVIATVRDADGRARVQALGAEALTVDVANPASVSGLAWQLDGEKIDLALYVAGVLRRHVQNARRMRVLNRVFGSMFVGAGALLAGARHT